MVIIGHVTLTVSLIIYAILYLPQLFHNARHGGLQGMSVAFHVLALAAAMTDLYYALGCVHQWQYVTVSGLALCCLLWQHYQWWGQVRFTSSWWWWLVTGAVLSALGAVLWGWRYGELTWGLSAMAGWVSMLLLLVMTLPQITKNAVTSRANGLCGGYLILVLVAALLDLVSAWLLHWPLPSLVGTPCVVLLNGILYWQWRTHRGSVIRGGM